MSNRIRYAHSPPDFIRATFDMSELIIVTWMQQREIQESMSAANSF